MNDNKIKQLIQDLEKKELQLAKTIEFLTFQGYVVNSSKLKQHIWCIIIKDILKQPNLLNDKEKESLMRLYKTIL